MADPTKAVAALGEPRVFVRSEEGSAAFGRWTLDQAGLPAYRYELDQYDDPRAAFPNSEGADRRDHWHQIGNDRITALAANDGTIQVYLCDRGGVLLNRGEASTTSRAAALAQPQCTPADDLYSASRSEALRQAQQPELADYLVQLHAPEETLTPEMSEELWAGPPPHAYSGGFSYLDDGHAMWATAFRYRPPGAKTRRVFGMGYFESELTHRNIRVTRRVYAPFDDKPLVTGGTGQDEPVLLVDILIENLGPAAVELRHYEYWDVNRYQLKLQWLRSGSLPAWMGDRERYAINENFRPAIQYDAQAAALRFHQTPCAPAAAPPDAISPIDWAPADIFLAALSDRRPAAYYTQKAAFFGTGDAQQPRPQPESASLPDRGMPCCLVLRHDLHLEPGATVKLCLALGTVKPGQSLQFLDKYRAGYALPDILQRWQSQLAYFTTGQPRDVFLQRETAWHAYNLLSATVRHDFYATHFVPQGSAYLYLHGADGVPRDQGLFVLPLTYLRPQLARDTLRLIMRLTHANDGAIPYAFSGYGVHDGAIVHTNPSDLDLFFMLALSEYLAATGDLAFLDCEEPFYPPGEKPATVIGQTVLDHLRVAADHLLRTIGVGEHGLLRIGDGDWSDSIVLETVLRNPLAVSFANSKASGESIPNTQMALYVLPLIAAHIRARDPALADALRGFAQNLKTHIHRQWSSHGNWYNRAILRDHLNKPVVWDGARINLEAQVWALISGLAAESGCEAALIESIVTRLDDPSPIGATLCEGGMVWPAVSQLLTWGYTHSRPDLAWRSLQRHSFAAHARAFPDVWINTWSGPDGVNGPGGNNPGGTWCSPLTPMTDFPVMNANQDAMALLGLLRVCGIEPAPAGDGLLIAPHAPPERFVLDVPLLRLEVSPTRIAGEYRACVDGSRVLTVRVPHDAQGLSATIDGQPVPAVSTDPSSTALRLSFRAGDRVAFAVEWQV